MLRCGIQNSTDRTSQWHWQWQVHIHTAAYIAKIKVQENPCYWKQNNSDDLVHTCVIVQLKIYLAIGYIPINDLCLVIISGVE